MTTLIALLSAFTLLRMADVARSVVGPVMARTPSRVSISRNALIAIASVCAIALAATGTYRYFDQVFLEEEMHNAWYRTLGGTVSGFLGKEPLLVVVPSRDNLADTNRYIELIAYDKLQDAQRRGVPLDSLYTAMSCEDPIETGISQMKYASPPRLIVSENVLTQGEPCRPEFLTAPGRLLSQEYPHRGR